MPSWRNATSAAPGTKGILRPARTPQEAGLQRDAAVAPELAPYVERYWSVRWDRRGQQPYRAEVLPHPSVNVAVEEGDGPRHGWPLPAVLVHGTVLRRFVVDLVGTGRVTAAKFRPGGFAALTGVVPTTATVRPLRHELGVSGTALLRAVQAERTEDARAAALDAALTTALRRASPEPPAAYLDLLDLVEELAADRTLVRVEDVARRAGLTTRALQRLFATYLGIGCKAVLQRYRLQDAVAALDSDEVDDVAGLAGLAASLGWYDQAHFTRDFRAAVGTTPSAYLARARADG